jgi:threonine dehydrogenase-like Zn-dependent dehydrogenase
MLARVDAAGICTSLIKLVEQGPDHSQLYGWDLVRFPLILGDEGSVTLAEVGHELRDRFHPGERYVIQPAVNHPPINHPERYRDEGRGVAKVAVGYTLPGHLAEYVLITEETVAAACLLPIRDPSFPFAHAALSEPLSCCVSAQDHHVHLVQETPLGPRQAVKGLRPGGVTVVIGAGTMGRMHVDLALRYRPRAIAVADLVEARLDLVRTLFEPRASKAGVDLQLVNPAATDLNKFVNQLTNYAGADDVIVAVGSKKAIESAQTLVGRGAVLDLFGGLKKGEDVIGLDTGIVHYKEINVTGSSGGSPWDIARTLEFMMAGEIDAGCHITRIGDLEHAREFLRMVMAQEIDGKAVVYPHRRSAEIRAVKSWSAQEEAEYLNQ